MNVPNRTIALVEPHWVGHPETQLKLFTEALLQDQSVRLLVLCQYPEVIREWADRTLPHAAARCLTAKFSYEFSRGGFPNTRLANWARLHATLARKEKDSNQTIDMVMITWLDPFLCSDPEQVATLMPRPWVGLYLFPTHLRPVGLRNRLIRSRRWREDHAFFRTPYCRGVAVLDEGVVRRLAALAPHIPVLALPDVPDTSLPERDPPLARDVRQRAAGRPVFSLLGVLGRRKGVLCFLRAALAIDPALACFVLAGRLGDDERKTYGDDVATLDALLAEARQRENVLFQLEPIETEAAFNAVVAASTVLYLAYQDHPHSSGLLGKAAYFGKLVVVGNYGCMRERMRRYLLGRSIPAASEQRAVRVIRELCDPATRMRLEQRARFDLYLAEHNRVRLHETLLRLTGSTTS